MLLREAGSTVVLVTHDPAEALDIADRIAVMEAGRIIQFGTPRELHDTPATASVGAIFSGAQVIPGTRAEEGVDTPFGLWPLASLGDACPDAPLLDLLVQADRLVPVADVRGGRVRDLHPIGPRVRVLLEGAQGAAITVETALPVDPLKTYSVIPDPESVRAFARD
jgi:iron(III) transport system ATP-binding protein